MIPPVCVGLCVSLSMCASLPVKSLSLLCSLARFPTTAPRKKGDILTSPGVSSEFKITADSSRNQTPVNSTDPEDQFTPEFSGDPPRRLNI